MERYFFEIPVYRCSPEQFKKENELLYQKIAAEFEPFKEILPTVEIEPNVQMRFLRSYYGYEYNETIGWIRLYVFGDQIRGRYYFETSLKDKEQIKKVFKRGIRKKQFTDFEKAFELTLSNKMRPLEIYDALLSELERVNGKERPFKNRFIDLSMLKNAGKYIDWHSVMKDLNFFNN